jgi:hypothetical protein
MKNLHLPGAQLFQMDLGLINCSKRGRKYNSLDDWWDKVNSRVDGPVKEGFNSTIILVAWSHWNHRNCCVFDGLQPNLNGVLSSIREELQLWDFAGARGITHILAQLPAG